MKKRDVGTWKPRATTPDRGTRVPGRGRRPVAAGQPAQERSRGRFSARGRRKSSGTGSGAGSVGGPVRGTQRRAHGLRHAERNARRLGRRRAAITLPEKGARAWGGWRPWIVSRHPALSHAGRRAAGACYSTFLGRNSDGGGWCATPAQRPADRRAVGIDRRRCSMAEVERVAEQPSDPRFR